MLHGFNFSKVMFMSTLVFTYSDPSNSHILQFQGHILQVCNAHPIKLIVTWLSTDRVIKGKLQKRIER